MEIHAEIIRKLKSQRCTFVQMFRLTRFLGMIGLLLCSTGAFSQTNSLHTKRWSKSDSLLLDSLVIYPNSLKIFCGKIELSSEQFQYSSFTGVLEIKTSCSDSFTVEYRTLPLARDLVYQKRDTSLLYVENKGDREKFLIQDLRPNQDVFGGSGLSKSGSISRGITFGNNQNLGINSSLNLELAGDIGPDLKLQAVLTDDNLPIQPDGNTNQLREFDQVFVQIYNNQFKLTAGDFWLRKPPGYFLTYQKRAQGLSFERRFQIDSARYWKSQFSGALSKGKFNRQIIQGVEGNQGPYKLTGADNEPFILILSGTEQVFIDGRLLTRGQEFDYIINYNTAEVIFTSRNLITKDSRIVVEFQYSDQNYARSLLQASVSYNGPKTQFWLNGFGEQDAKNQPIQQNLSLGQKQLLASVGDSLLEARSTSIDSIGFVDNQVLYALVDSLGYDSVLVVSVHPDSAFYRASFLFVGPGNGDYVFSNFNALGRVYRWIAPVNGVSQGDYIPARILAAPKKQQMVNAGVSHILNEHWTLENEVAISVKDVNTFSRLDANDNNGVANKFRVVHRSELGKKSRPWLWSQDGSFEYLDANFQPIQQYRAVEFDRDWNVRFKNYKGEQFYSILGTEIKRDSFGSVQLQGQRFSIGNDFEGYNLYSLGNLNTHNFKADWQASYLTSQAETANTFNRHRADISQGIGGIRLGYKDDFEENKYTGTGYSLDKTSYRFYDYQFYISNNDSSDYLFKTFFRERYDWRSDSSRLNQAAKAQTIGGELSIRNWTNQNLTIVANYRSLKVLDSVLLPVAPENTLLGRVDYEFRAFKNALIFSNFFETGSGLELKREFLYIQVNDGQGIYTWIDYNGDGVKDLNEFEIAQFVDQASYIRVFTPSNTYTKTYSNELNQSLSWRPERLWASSKGIKKALSFFSTQTRYRIQRKNSGQADFTVFNPTQGTVRDTQLISTSSTFRNTVYFNRTSPIFSTEYTYQINQGKTLLASGFDGRLQEYHEVKPQVNIARQFLLEVLGQKGRKLIAADYTSGRNYDLQYEYIQPSVAYQPNTYFRWTVGGRYTEKQNDPSLGNESAFLGELNTEFKYNQPEKGSLIGGFKLIQINFDGNPNSALGFEMLEGLKNGRNYTWNLGYQRSLSKNLQISIQYNGRQSENSKTIHSGGMEVRAFF